VNVDPEMSSRVALPVRVRVGEAIDFLGQSDERPASGVADDRHDQAAVGGRRQPNVVGAPLHNLARGLVQRRVQLRKLRQKRQRSLFMMNGRYDNFTPRSAQTGIRPGTDGHQIRAIDFPRRR